MAKRRPPSARHSLRPFLYGVLALLGVLVLFNYDSPDKRELQRWQREARAEGEGQRAEIPANPTLDKRAIVLAGQGIEVEVADTPRKRSLGLSNRTSLEEGAGMLFTYSEEGSRSLWMKDMNFAIDMIWFDSSRAIIHIEHDVGPETYPESFASEDPAMYMLEVPAGYARRNGIEIGSRFDWE